MQSKTRAIGASLDRIDGPKKVTGAAPYAYEQSVEGVTYVFPVQSAIAKGRVAAIEADAALALPGVLAVISHENVARLPHRLLMPSSPSSNLTSSPIAVSLSPLSSPRPWRSHVKRRAASSCAMRSSRMTSR